ncbi:MAG: histidine phosphatase family protein [Propionibacteriaceae bacterium]|jgi:broad specificity phosphatase PhoE|nr:histidine phosphatase family protein [Propionibacteriaceae bacterium]
MMSVVKVVRHGQVHNPQAVLYGRLPGFGLSDLGGQMAVRLGEYFAGANLVHLVSSPLQRALETMAPIAAGHPELEVHLDRRAIEAGNVFEGVSFGKDYALFRNPANWWAFRNPLRPSWGEPYREIAARMHAAIASAHEAATRAGGDAVIVSHELPIWMARLSAQGKLLPHDPRHRQARLASVTTFTVEGSQVRWVGYDEPAQDLTPPKRRKFRPGA